MNTIVMMYYALLLSLQLISLNACKTTVPVADLFRPLMELPPELKECSGMISIGSDNFLALNDSGNKPYLYVFNSSGDVQTKIIRVNNVKNNDWEELASDDEYIYIGDFGNNGGTRQNLMVYRIPKAEILSKTEVVPDIISFRYEGQTKYNDSNRHNFDCEAMIVKGDSLFLFSKNRGDFRTDVYGFPKIPGEYVTKIMGSYDSDGLVTGADYRENGKNGELVLVGYSIHGKAYYPFILYFAEVKGTRFLEGQPKRITYEKVLQTETISFAGTDKVIVTNEEEDGSEGRIYEVLLKN